MADLFFSTGPDTTNTSATAAATATPPTSGPFDFLSMEGGAPQPEAMQFGSPSKQTAKGCFIVCCSYLLPLSRTSLHFLFCYTVFYFILFCVSCNCLVIRFHTKPPSLHVSHYRVGILIVQLNAFVLGFDAFGDLLQPSGGSVGAAGFQAGGPKPSPAAGNKVLTGDLDSSLASLAMNLTINKSQQPKY